MSRPRVAFCGVGALGSHAALFCRNLAADLVLVDFDRVEAKNLAAQAFVKPSLGKNKADALRLQLTNLHGATPPSIQAFGVRLAEGNVETVLAGATLLVDAFDNKQSRELLSAYARKHERPLVHAGIAADGSFGLVRWDERFVPDAEDREGQATCEGGDHLPMIALVSAALARTIADHLASGEKRDSLISLRQVTTHE